MSGKSLRAGTVMAEIAELRRELLLRDAKLEAFTAEVFGEATPGESLR